jgi:hypothetical protein
LEDPNDYSTRSASAARKESLATRTFDGSYTLMLTESSQVRPARLRTNTAGTRARPLDLRRTTPCASSSPPSTCPARLGLGVAGEQSVAHVKSVVVVERFRFVGVSLASRDGESESEGESRTASATLLAGDIWRRDGRMECPPLKYGRSGSRRCRRSILPEPTIFADLWTHTIQDVTRSVVLNMHLPVGRSAGGFLWPDASLVLCALDTVPTIPRSQTGLGPWRRVSSGSSPLRRSSILTLGWCPLRLSVTSWYVLHI